MRISDWSSDVCSSDLQLVEAHVVQDRQILVEDLRVHCSLPVEEFLGAVVLRGDDREEELRAFTSRWDTRGDIPLEPPPLIPLGAQGIYPVDVNLHVDRKSTRLNSSH